MQLHNTQSRFGVVAMSLHWLTVALVLAAWLLGTFGDVFPKGPTRAAGLTVHISLGLAILAALAVRIAWRLRDQLPLTEPTSLGVLGDKAGRAAHYALYVLLIAVPIVGIVLQFARGEPLPVFGLLQVASPWAADRTFAGSVKGIHEVLANALIIVAGIHAAAAIFHHWYLKDRTLERMLP
ncbi:MAG: cytochrome b [Hyphomicrobiaceae bacterium]